jgi:hypothetical protein
MKETIRKYQLGFRLWSLTLTILSKGLISHTIKANREISLESCPKAFDYDALSTISQGNQKYK